MKLDSNTVLSVREQQNMIDSWQKNRLQNLLPALMKKHGIDMWIIACREDNQDPVLTGMLPQGLSADKGIVLPPGGNQIIIVFHELENGEVERLLISALKLRDLYKNMWDESKETEWECLERVVKEKNPTRIGLNTSSTFAHADGLTFTQYSSVMNSLRPFEKRVVSAEKLAVDWLQQRTKEELSFYPTIARIGHSIIEKAFSNDVIVPGKTTTEDVGWWMRQRIRDIGLQAWFKPMVAVSRKGQQEMDFNATIQRGDIIFCDIGLDYMGLQTDTQRQAYVLQERETEVPAGIQKAMQTCNQLQDGFLFECKAGRTGNDILGSIQENAKQAEIDALISSHPVGVYGHGPGACIGVWHEQKNVPVRGDYRIPDNTCYAMELCVIVPIPEWDNQRIAFHLEQTVAIQNGKTTCLDDRQTRFYLIS